MMKVSGHVGGTVCGEVSESVGLEKADVKEAGSGNETPYLAFIALKSIAVGREPPSKLRERQRDILTYGISVPKKEEPKEPRDFPAYAVHEPKEPRSDGARDGAKEPRDRGDKW